jgi:hypothetical protein
MKNLILALSQANIPPNGIETILTEFEVWVDSKVLRSKEQLMIETIVPLQKETDGIRSEVSFLAETMKHGFARMEERFQSMDQKIDFTRKFIELQISATRENLKTQINAIEKNMEKQFSFHEKLLWAVLSVVLGLFAKAIHLI